jgi:uncharacterized membrane protein YphA (DoxX/SURF4 family)
MRTNPFLDAWLFVVGLTDEPYAVGVFTYAFVVLFFGLLVAAVWIALINWRNDASQRNGADVATWACRILIGCMWFQQCLWKLPLPIADGFQYWTEQMAEHAAFAVHRELVTEIYLPYLMFIDPLVFLAEISFAISLILGFSVRFFGSLAVLFSMHLWLGLYLHPGEWPWNYLFLAVIHVLFVAHAAGRSLGADALLRRRGFSGLAGRLVTIAS